MRISHIPIWPSSGNDFLHPLVAEFTSSLDNLKLAIYRLPYSFFDGYPPPSLKLAVYYIAVELTSYSKKALPLQSASPSGAGLQGACFGPPREFGIKPSIPKVLSSHLENHGQGDSIMGKPKILEGRR